MKSDDSNQKRLESLLNDERARTAWLESELAKLAERASRPNSGPRTGDVPRPAPTVRSRIRRLIGRARPKVEPTGTTEPQTRTPSSRVVPRYPAIRALVDHRGQAAVGSLFDCIDLADADGPARGSADILVVSSSTIARELANESLDVLEWEARVPFVVIDDGAERQVAGILGRNDLVITSNPGNWPEQSNTAAFPVVNTPVLRPVRPKTKGLEPMGPGVMAGVGADGQKNWMLASIDADAGSLAQHAMCGVPVIVAGEGAMTAAQETFPSPDLLRRASVLTRRWLDARFSPWAMLPLLVDVTGLDLPGRPDSIGVALITNRPEFVGAAIENLARQALPPSEVFVGLHGLGDPAEVERQLDQAGLPGRSQQLNGDWPLGKCMNVAVEELDTRHVAKIDDDDFYGSGYLLDAHIAIRSTSAHVVGKATHYVYVEEAGTTYRIGGDNEDRIARYVPGPSLVFNKEVWEAVPFAHRHSRVDSTFVRGVNAVGGRIWSTTRDELEVVRRPGGHTSTTGARRFAARGEALWDGPQKNRCVAWDGPVSGEGLLMLEESSLIGP